ncbi:hypothetical protein AC579_7726 [Pseudocercospora musae]|uniref:Uncharacterized protein n=1 Tax=Pseudocercospora musae TaxID=113226 RepID=A0A139IU15_9PEZI|nr:hypothetical protein AC579_7726 [Pseudocercospora musae]
MGPHHNSRDHPPPGRYMNVFDRDPGDLSEGCCLHACPISRATDFSLPLADFDPMPPEMNSESQQSRTFVCVDYGCSFTGTVFGLVPGPEPHLMDWSHEQWDGCHAADTHLPQAVVSPNATRHVCLSCTQKRRRKRRRTFYTNIDSRVKGLQHEVSSNALNPTTLVPTNL